MSLFRFSIVLLLLMSISAGCTKKIPADAVVISESFFTVRNEADNVDSPAVWHGPSGENWLIATAKETHVLLVYDASSGEFISRQCEPGNGPGQLMRPNGIAVIDSLLFIVERDNHRVQLIKLPGFTHVGFVGENELIRPYGITIFTNDSGSYTMYITDNYEKNEAIPPDNELGERVHEYTVAVSDGVLISNLEKKFGDTAGNGVLRKVETLYADPANDLLLVCEELTESMSVKVYRLDGTFTGTEIGKNEFEFEPEGIALYQTGTDTGYYIITDQDMQLNRFHMYDRKSFNFLGTFYSEGTKNTDGVWLTQQSFGRFPGGAFYAVHDDGNVGAFDLEEILSKMNLEH